MSLLANPAHFFSEYIHLTGVAHLGPEREGLPSLRGKRLGLLNGSSWITAWSSYFGRLYTPGAHLVNAGNEAIQLNFMQAYSEGRDCPPQANIERFIQYARDLVELAQVDAVLITCSTMNRSYHQVQQALEPYKVPVIQIDMAMMERAVALGGKALVIATHGPTVASTQALLTETAQRTGGSIRYAGLTLEDAWHQLASGDILGHNQTIAAAIRAAQPGLYSCVVLAQLSMSAFAFSFPEPEKEFGIPIFNSGQCGFEAARSVLEGLPES